MNLTNEQLSTASIFLPTPQIRTTRLLLRKILPSDADDMFAYASDEMVTRYISYHHHHLDESRERIDMLTKAYNTGECMIWGAELKEEAKMIGAAGFTRWDKMQSTAEIGYTLGQPYWGRGLAKEIVLSLFRFGFEYMQLNRIEARCWVENERSAFVMQACGMQYEGVLRAQLLNHGKFRDVKMYSILRSEFV